MTIVVVSPHRDDAAFSLGLSVDSWLEAGHAVRVLNCFTRSAYAPHADFEFIHSNDRMPRVSALRLREDQNWQKMYRSGLQMTDLNLKDAPLRLHVGLDQICTLAVKPDDKAMDKIPKGVAALTPDALVLPLGLGSHVDHMTARDAMTAAGLPAALPVAFYEDLPYAARPGIAETIDAAATSLGKYLQAGFVTRSGAIEEAVERKRRLALCYDSQIVDEEAEQIAGFCRHYGGRERMWSNDAWRSAGLAVDEEAV